MYNSTICADIAGLDPFSVAAYPAPGREGLEPNPAIIAQRLSGHRKVDIQGRRHIHAHVQTCSLRAGAEKPIENYAQAQAGHARSTQNGQ